MKRHCVRLAWVVIGGLCVAGCASSSSPTTKPAAAAAGAAAPSAANVTTAPATAPAAPAAPALADKDFTHVLKQDSPYYESLPGSAAVPSGSLKEGTKVLVMIPGAPYSQVETPAGKVVYTTTAGLKPLGK